MATTVLKIYGYYMGIRHVNAIYPELMDVSDVYHTLEFFEMKPETTITYVKKEKDEDEYYY
jgi:hypothetical protein